MQERGTGEHRAVAVLAALGLGAAFSAPAAERNWQEYVLTPKSDTVRPVAVVETRGRVEGAESLLRADAAGMRLAYPKGGEAPHVVFDLGAASAGGYPVFTVKSRRGTPVVRLAYACFKGACGERGDFERGSCTYLGKDFALPVLPANPGRFDLFTIPREGGFIAPLLQGQVRWVRVQPDTEDTEVEIASLAIENHEVHDRGPTDGWFLCDDERINRAWYASAWTLQLASFPNHNAWAALDGWLLPRQLARSGDVGLSKEGADWKDVRFEFDFEIRRNPYGVSGAGWVVRAQDERNGYIGAIDLNGQFTLRVRKDGADSVLKQVRLEKPVLDGERHHVCVALAGPRIATSLDGRPLDETGDATFGSGRVGFCQPKEAWALFAKVRVAEPGGPVLLQDDFTGGLERWDFARTTAFVADGAKRDRLVWSGDLYWAQRNVYCAFRDAHYLADSVRMLAFNQTPEGYVQACPYPENRVPPAAGDYGPFPSDEFSAWLVPVAWDHYCYTGDRALLVGIRAAAVRDADYLWRSVGPDGLFHPRKEVSKHADNLQLGDVSTRTFLNILVQDTQAKAALIARATGAAEDAARLEARAVSMKEAINRMLWNAAGGFFQKSREDPKIGQTACALAMAMRFASAEQAAAMAPQSAFLSHGKFQSLMVRGLFEYGFNARALEAFFAHNWAKIADQKDVPQTVTECMNFMHGGWGDESHPDTAVAGLLSGYVLGVEPTAPGFATFSFAPHPAGRLHRAAGAVPAPPGAIAASWNMESNRFTQTLSAPKGTRATIAVPRRGLASFRIAVNGVEVRDAAGKITVPPGIEKVEETVDYVWLRNATPGDWTVVTEAGEGSAFFAPAAAPGAASPSWSGAWKVAARTSHEAGGWGVSHLEGAPSAHGGRGKGYSSEGNGRAEAEEWIEIDLGAERALKGVVLYPRADAAAAAGGSAGFPVDYTLELKSDGGTYRAVKTCRDVANPMGKPVTNDFYTVVGFPSARHLRLRATRLGSPPADEPGVFRLQLGGIEVMR